jgi:hypothetical protein
MPKGRWDFGRGAVVLASSAAILLAFSLPLAVARDESGLYAFIQQQQPRQMRQQFYAPFYGYAPVRSHPRRSARRTTTERPIVGRASPNAFAAVEAGGWMAAILADSTLRKGDIVIFADGPKVFTGGSGEPPWADTDFVELATTKLIAQRTRESVLALTRLGGGALGDSGQVKRMRVTITASKAAQ